ncbi:hypothetical protein [Streptomyces sp. NPDC007369]|uniref:hypothetical protein n=1 Tax=Streptomyces sp. NPDC007369 TaxID=3154589 RepID=UPI0033DDA778
MTRTSRRQRIVMLGLSTALAAGGALFSLSACAAAPGAPHLRGSADFKPADAEPAEPRPAPSPGQAPVPRTGGPAGK